MNSFSPLNRSNSPILPPCTALPHYTFIRDRLNIPPLEIPNLNNLSVLNTNYSPSNSTISRPLTINNFTPLTSPSPLRDGLSPISQELGALLLSWKLQQTLQAELLKAQMEHIAELKNSLLEKFSQSQSQSEIASLKTSPVKPETAKGVEIAQENVKSVQKTASPGSKKKDLKSQIKDIVHFVLDNFGRINESSFDDEKLNYADNKQLVMVFDLLSTKYSSTIKTKEEMVKYTLRRAFKFIKSHIRKENNMNTKGVSKTLCSKYFKASQDEISKIGNEEDFLKSVLPFRKNSRNKTMNTSFIGEVFSSENFSKDYERYLQNFDAILEADNNSKIDRLVEFIEDCVKAEKIQDIRKYKRIPWPKLWIANTKKIAQDLPTIGAQGGLDSPHNLSKKVKTEENLSSSMTDKDSDSQMSTDTSQ